MNKICTKSIMLLVIYSFSIFIFSLAYNVCFHTEYQIVKDSDFLSDSYVVIRFQSKKPNIETLNQWAENAHCHYFMTILEWSQGKTVAFSEKFFRDLGIDKSCLDGLKTDADIAVVNEDALDMCYEAEDGLYLKLQGVTYKVIATYQDFQDDRIYETFYYLNQKAESLKNNKEYDYVLLDPVAGESIENMTNQFKKAFSDVSVSEWKGTKSGSMDNRPYFVLVTMLVAILLCVNCIGFSNEWVKAQMQELEVRKLVGATNGQNNRLILKRFLRIFFVSSMLGMLMTTFTLFAIKNVSTLGATKSLFGTYLYGKSALLAAASVLTIGVFMTEISFFFLRTRNVLVNIRGEK